MGLFGRNVKIHIDKVEIHNVDSAALKDIQTKLLNIIKDMADTKKEFLAILAGIAGSLTTIGGSVDNVSTDVTELLKKITDGTTPEGGLNPADTAEVKAALQGIADSAATAASNIQAVADKYKNAGEQPAPNPEPEPAPEPPVEG